MRRRSALVFVSLLAAAGCLAPSMPALAAAPVPANRTVAAPGWLARQLVDGSHFTLTYQGVTYPDQGETIDALFAFAATGTASGHSARALAWLARPSVLADYIGNGTTSSYAGATAKVLLAAEVGRVNPARFGKVNLVARLRKLLAPSGRYRDHSKFGDYSNAFSQALAIIALSRRGGAPARAVRFLIGSECANGGFPLDFAQKTCASYPDATAMDVQALLAAGQTAAAQRGLHWLARIQRPDGAFVAEGVANANSTGLAGEALAAGGWPRRAARARAFLLSLQAGCPAPVTRRGALAYDATGFQRSTAIDATAQGILGLADVSLARISTRGASAATPRLDCGS
jgi:hypothetical protein